MISNTPSVLPGHVIIPEQLNVPPSLVDVMVHDPGLPNCMMLHKNLMVAWDSFPLSSPSSWPGILVTMSTWRSARLGSRASP